VKLKLDENVPVDLLDDLRAAGHDADSVYGEGLGGAHDTPLLGRLKDEGRALLTLDVRLADVRVHPPAAFAGIVPFRPRGSGRRAVIAFVRRHLPDIYPLDLAGKLVVISDTGVRIR
jgi:hypothetical protein